MMRTTFLSLATAAVLTAAVSAQAPCSDNLWPLHLVNANGVQAPSVLESTGRYTYSFTNEAVYLAFDPTIASGTYYVHVTSHGLEEVVSTNDPMDRFVHVENNAGVISLSLPFTNNQNPAVFGTGLGGVGQSLLLKFRSSDFSPCSWKVLLGNKWDLSNGPTSPYLIDGGVLSDGSCAVRSYDGFKIGDGNGSDVTGQVFKDSDRDGNRDSGESGLAGWEVKLVSDTTEVTTLTDSAGNYRFANVAAGEYEVEVEVKSGYCATNASSLDIVVCSCADRAVAKFGVACVPLPCNSKPLSWWKSKSGCNKFRHFNLLPALHLVNHWGQRVAPGCRDHFQSFLRCGTASNMASQLSCELLAMNSNVLAGYVHPDCVIKDPCLGTMTIGQLIQRAVLSLACHPSTPLWHSQRQNQTNLKNCLERANENRIWR